MTTEQQRIEAAIAALQSQRATLGDAVLDLATPFCAPAWPPCCARLG
jgi:hypothetical protein